MKLEIKTNERGSCEYFKIDGRKFGKGIYSCTIFINADEKPTALIEARLDEFILDSEDCVLYLDKIKKDRIFKRIIKKFTKGVE